MITLPRVLLMFVMLLMVQRGAAMLIKHQVSESLAFLVLWLCIVGAAACTIATAFAPLGERVPVRIVRGAQR